MIELLTKQNYSPKNSLIAKDILAIINEWPESIQIDYKYIDYYETWNYSIVKRFLPTSLIVDILPVLKNGDSFFQAGHACLT